MTENEIEAVAVSTKLTEKGPCAKSLEVTIAAADVDKEFELVVRELAQQVRLPGFRPGKTPKDVVFKKFGADIVKQVTQNLLQRGFRSAIDKDKLDVVGEPSVDTNAVRAEKGAAFVFTAEVEVKPAFEVANYKGLDAEQEEIEVLPEEFTQALERIQNRFAEPVDVGADYAVKESDAVQGVLRYVVDGNEVHKEEDAYLIAMDGLVLGVDAALKSAFLTGVKVGEKRTAEETLNERFPKEELRGKKALIEFEVKSIRAKKMPELNDELAKKLNFNSVDELKDKVRSSLVENLSEEIKSRTQYDLLDKIVAATPFPLPERLTKVMQYKTMQSSAQYLAQMGMDAAGFAQIKDQFAEDSKQKAETEMRRYFVVDAIAAKENLSVADDEIDEEVVKRARQQGMRASEFYDKILQDGSIKELEVDLKIQKVLAFLVENANVKVVPRKPLPKGGAEGAHDHGHSHGHSHGGVACSGDHGHSHGGESCGHDHGAHGHSHG